MTETTRQIEISYLESLETLFDRVKTIIAVNPDGLPPFGSKNENYEHWGGFMMACTQARNQQKKNGRETEETDISNLSSPELFIEMKQTVEANKRST